MNSVIMDGAVIGEESIVAAMCFVKAGFIAETRSLVAGIPGKVMRQVSDEEYAWKMDGTRTYQDLALRSAKGMVECAPLTEIEANRPTIDAGDTKPLYQTKG